MVITDFKELKAVAMHRYKQQHFTKPKIVKLAVIVLIWVIALMVLMDNDSTVWFGVGWLIIGYVIGFRWANKIDKRVTAMARDYQERGLEG